MEAKVDKQPTAEQIKEFWEWCGFEWHEHIRLYKDPIHGLISSILPQLDLNNLFKYAVPKLFENYFTNEITFNLDHVVYINSLTYSAKINDGGCSEFIDDPALALFWAIWEVIKKEK